MQNSFGDFLYGEIFETVVYWAPVTRSTLDAFSHACGATRRHLAHSRDFSEAVFTCRRRCHVRYYLPSKRLRAFGAPFPAVWRFCSELPTLQEVSLNGTLFCDEEINSIVSQCKNLRHLDLDCVRHGSCGTVRLGNESALTIAQVCGDLLSLNLCDWNLTDDAAVILAASCTQLQSLNVGRVSRLTDKSLNAVAAYCPHMRVLDVSRCRITSLSVQRLAAHCSELRSLNLACCAVDDCAIFAIARHCPHLVSLNVCDGKPE